MQVYSNNGSGVCYKPSTVFVKMLAILIALCLWEGSSRKSMETWKELDLLFLISVSVVVPCKENAKALNDQPEQYGAQKNGDNDFHETHASCIFIFNC